MYMETIYPYIKEGEKMVAFNLDVLVSEGERVTIATVKDVSDDVFSVLRHGDLQEVRNILNDLI